VSSRHLFSIGNVRDKIKMEMKYLLYFFLGGSVVSLVSYFANHSKGLIAAFFANLPVIPGVFF